MVGKAWTWLAWSAAVASGAVLSPTGVPRLMAAPTPAAANATQSEGPSLIINGQDVNGNKVPAFIVSLWLRDQWTSTAKHRCGGTLISDQWVITAAHCFLQCASKSNTQFDCPKTLIPKSLLVQDSNDAAMAYIGGRDLSDTSSFFAESRIADILIHPYYYSSGRPNENWDVALVRLATRVKSAENLPRLNADPSLPAIGIYGWGSRDIIKWQLPTLLGTANIKTIECTRDVPLNDFCAKGAKKGSENLPTQSCFGDSGGPWLQKVDGKLTLVGITSWGNGDCTDDIVFRTANAQDWVQYVTNIPAEESRQNSNDNSAVNTNNNIINNSPQVVPKPEPLPTLSSNTDKSDPTGSDTGATPIWPAPSHDNAPIWPPPSTNSSQQQEAPIWPPPSKPGAAGHNLAAPTSKKPSGCTMPDSFPPKVKSTCPLGDKLKGMEVCYQWCPDSESDKVRIQCINGKLIVPPPGYIKKC